MSTSDAVIAIFLNDWPVNPHGINAGGGEHASISLARAFGRLGRTVVIFAVLPDGDCEVDGIRYWNIGSNYDLKRAHRRLEALGNYHAFAATLPHPFLFMSDDPKCLSRILINHAPSSVVGGLEPSTLLQISHFVVCVSNAQKQIFTDRQGIDSGRVLVIKNGFDPELLEYHGPQARNWRKLLFVGRLSQSKGIHHLIDAFISLKNDFADLELLVCGDPGYWPDLARQVPELESRWSGLRFLGALPHAQVLKEMRSAGILVFPSTTFETAGLAVVEAQASGCPVVASAVGGVPEYVHRECGVLIPETSALALYETLLSLLRDEQRLSAMSHACLTHGRAHSWDDAARELLALTERIGQDLRR